MALAVPPRRQPGQPVNGPVLVAGGGLAGAAAAALLARAGSAVTLIERAAGPTDKICGEFLSGEAVAFLATLGLDARGLGGQRIDHVRLVCGARAVTAALPFTGIGLSRFVLDEALLRHAEACGAQVLRGQTVQGVEMDGDRVSVALDGMDTLPGRALLLATGKHTLRGMPRLDAPVNGLIGLKMYFELEPAPRAALSGHVELILFPGGYAGLQMVEGGRANLCLLVQKEPFRRLGGWDGMLDWLCETSPHLAARLAGAVPLLQAPLAIARIPYGFVHRAAGADHIFRIGDQAGVIASFTGDGMAIALHSAGRAAAALLRGQGAASYHAALARDLTKQIGRADRLYRLAARPTTQKLLLAGARLWPGSLAWAARATRVSEANANQ